MKNDRFDSYVTKFGAGHVILLVPYAINFLLLPQLWAQFRKDSYFELGEFPCADSPDSGVRDFMGLALPHGLFNIKADPQYALGLGLIVNLCLCMLTPVIRVVTRRNPSAISITASFLYMLESLWLIGMYTTLLLPGSIEWKMPSMPAGILYNMLIAAASFSDLSMNGAPSCDLASAGLKVIRHSGLLEYSDDLISLRGFGIFRSLQNGKETTQSTIWLFWQLVVSCFRGLFSSEVPRNLQLIILLTSFTLMLDLVVSYQRLKRAIPLLFSQRLNLSIVLAPFSAWMMALVLVFVYLTRYPTCTMSDAEPGSSSALNDEVLAGAGGQSIRLSKVSNTQAVAPHMIFTKAFQHTGDVYTHADIYLPLKLIEDWIDSDYGVRSNYTVFTATRYNRATAVMWPFTLNSVWGQKTGLGRAAILSWPLTRALLRNDIPSVVVDSRGSGGSSGVRYMDLDDVEIAEMNEVARWAKDGFWTKPYLAAGGISYDGMTALKMSTKRDSPIDLTLGLYSPLAPVTDLLQLDGIPCQSFLDDYEGITSTFEQHGSPRFHIARAAARGMVPIHTMLGFTNVFSTAVPASGWSLDLSPRSQRWSMRDQAMRKMFTSDVIHLNNNQTTPITSAGLTEADFHLLKEKDISGYYVFGECDSSAYRVGQRLQRIWQTSPTNQSSLANVKIVYGPWAHGGRRGCDLGGSESGSWPCSEEAVYDDCVGFIQQDFDRKASLSSKTHATVDIRKWETNPSLETGGKWISKEEDSVTSQSLIHFGLDPSTRNLVGMSARNKSDPQSTMKVMGHIDDDFVWTRTPEVFDMKAMMSGLYNSQATRKFLKLAAEKRALRFGVKKSILIQFQEFVDKITSLEYYRIPRLLRNDFRSHWRKSDWIGLAHDASDWLSWSIHRLKRSLFQKPQGNSSGLTPMSREDLDLAFLEGDLAEWTTGDFSRWVIVQHLMRLPVEYSLIDVDAGPSLVVESSPLREDVPVHGSPYVDLRMFFDEEDASSNGDMCGRCHGSLPDAASFAPVSVCRNDDDYGVQKDAIISIMLHSRDPDGHLHYITEGRLLLSMKGNLDRDWNLSSESLK